MFLIVLVNGIILWTFFFFQMEATSQNRKQKGKDEKIPEAEKIDGKIRKKRMQSNETDGV